MTDPATTNGLDPDHHDASARPLPFSLSAVEDVRTAATDLEKQLGTLVRERPVVAVLTAAGIGYFLARILSRSTR